MSTRSVTQIRHSRSRQKASAPIVVGKPVAAVSGGRVQMQQMSFKVGDKAVYPAHGVGEVTAIENREISGTSQTFYILRILDNGMKIMIPTNNVRQVGLREVIGRDKV